MAKLLIVSLLALSSVVYAQFTAADKTQILDAHNAIRSQIALGNYKVGTRSMPAAKNMKKMKWSTSLATQAQTYSANCVFEHSGQNGVGENLYTAKSSGTITIAGRGLTASNRWADEYQKYNWTSVFLDDVTWATGIGHATQMTWADTDMIGCGASLCESNSRVIVVCQYQSPGNYMNQYIYQTGTTCSACPAGTTCEAATGLCV